MSPPLLPRITDYLAHWAAERPGREAVIGSGRRLGYRALRDEVDRCARALLAQGIRRGQRVCLVASPGPTFMVVFLATASVGGIWVGLNPKYTLAEKSQVVGDSEPSLIVYEDDAPDAELRTLTGLSGARVVTADGWEAFLRAGDGLDPSLLAAARAAVVPQDPAAMVFTSGSTGRSKGALVPHGGLASTGVVQAAHWYDDDVRHFCDLPINHIGCLGDICCAVLTAGGTLAFLPRFDPEAALALVERERLTHWLAIPTQLIAAVEAAGWGHRDLSSLKRVIWGGAAAPAPLLRTLAASTKAVLCTSYSLTESTGSVTFTADGDDLDLLTWSIGTVDPAYEVGLFAPGGARVRPGTQGEIRIRGDFVTRGYFRNPGATASLIDGAGWLHTGDLAVEEAGGQLRLVGRLHDMFKSGGENVYPREVELVLEEHPAVALAAVVGVPDERWGEVGHCYVKVTADVSEVELRAFCRDRLANYKVPKRFLLAASLPTLPIGKVDKQELRRRAGLG